MKEVIMKVPSFSADYPKAPIYVADLVRCKEYKRSYIEGQTTLYRVCGLHDITTDENNYCSWGEREGE